MRGRPKLNWRVPADEWEAFLAHVREEHGETKGYVGREVERAMREYIDADEHAPLEVMVDRLVKAAGRTPETLLEKNLHVDQPEGETVRVRCRVDADLKESFGRYVKRETEDSHGVVLTRALRERRDGGRAGRVMRKLRRVHEDAESVLSEINPDADGRMSLRKRRTVAICTRLGQQFTRADLEEVIGDVAGDSPPTIEAYTESVVDRLNYVPHPNNSDLFIPETKAREMVREEATGKADVEMSRAMGGTPEAKMATDGGEVE